MVGSGNVNPGMQYCRMHCRALCAYDAPDMQDAAGTATGATVEPGLKIETANIGRADDPTAARDVQPSPFAVKRTVNTDTQQRSEALQDGCTPSASGVSGLSSQSPNPKKPKGRSGPKSKCSPYIGVSQYKRTGRWEVSGCILSEASSWILCVFRSERRRHF